MNATSCEAHMVSNGDPCKVPHGGAKATYSYTPIPATYALTDQEDPGACLCTLSGVFLQTGKTS